MMAKKSLTSNSEQCVLDFKEAMLLPKTQGPHNVAEGVKGKTVRVEEINLHTEIVDKAYLRITDQGQVDLILNFDHNPSPVFTEDK